MGKKLKKRVLQTVIVSTIASTGVSAVNYTNDTNSNEAKANQANYAPVFNLIQLTEKAPSNFTMNYELSLTVPDSVRAGDTVAIKTVNLADFTANSNKAIDVSIDGTVIGKLVRTSTVSNVLKQQDPNTTLDQKRAAGLEAGTATNEYKLTFNENASRFTTKALKLAVNAGTVPATSVKQPTPVNYKVIVNGNEVISDHYTISKARINPPIQVGSSIVDLESNTVTSKKADGTIDNRLGIIVGPYDKDYAVGSELMIKLPADSPIQFVRKDLTAVKPVKEFPFLTDNSEANPNNVYLHNYNNPEFEVKSMTNDTLVLKLKRGSMIRQNHYVITSENVPVSFEFTEHAKNQVSPDGLTIGLGKRVSSELRDPNGVVGATHGNPLAVNVYGGTVESTGVLKAYSNVNVQYVDEAGQTIKEAKKLYPQAKVEGSNYSVAKELINGYQFIRAEGELAGTLGKQDKTVKLVYKKDASFVVENGKLVHKTQRVEELPFKTVYRDNPEVYVGTERVITEGVKGSKTIISVRQTDDNQQPTGDPVVTENVTKQPVNRVIERGTKTTAGTETVTTEKVVPFKTIERENPSLFLGETRVITEGSDGVNTVTTVYKTEKGKRVGEPTVTETVKTPPVNRVIDKGIKAPNGTELIKEKELVPFKTVYKDNPERYEGEETVITDGEEGLNSINKLYLIEKGKRVGEPKVSIIKEKEPVNRVIERGTKPINSEESLTDKQPIPFKTVYKDNPELELGTEKTITEGVNGELTKKTVYKTVKGKRVGDPVVTETVTKQPVDRVIERGTKKPQQPLSELYNPNGKDQTVFVGEKPDPKASVENYKDLPEGTVVKWEKDPDTAKPGDKPSVLLFEYPDRSVERVSVTVHVVEKEKEKPKQPLSELYNPNGKEQTVFVGEKPEPKASVENYKDLPEGTIVKWEKDPDTATPGNKPSVLLFEYPDHSVERVSVVVTAIPKPEPKDQTVFVGETPKAEDSIGNYPQLPEGTRVSWLVPPKTDKPGVVDGVVLIEYPDGRRVEVPVRVTVVEKEKEKQPPQKQENNNGENGNNKDKDKNKDSNKDKPTPQGKDQTVKVGENPLVQDSIANHKDLPKGTKLSWEKTPDTTKPGVIEAVVLVEYPDGTSEKVTVRVTVVENSDKDKEKNNHENNNKTNTDNKTPDKKEQNQNKQPDRKEAIKTGVGIGTAAASGAIAAGATTLALSAFALRRRKKQ